MKNVLAILACSLFLSGLSAQDKTVRHKALGLSFIMYDFTTPQRIRTGSLSRVLNEKNWADFNEMAPGFALTYLNGLTPYVDFAGTLNASYVNYPLRNRSISSGEALLLEGDVSAQLKMFDESFPFTPYVSVGAGVSRYRQYYGAFVPLGFGFKANLFD